MRKLYYLFLLALLPQLAGAYTQQRVSVHDPSIVWEPTSQTYYVFGSHEAWAKSTDLMNWSNVPVAWRTKSSPSVTCETAFNVNATTTIKVGGVNRDFTNGNGASFDAEAFSAAGDGSYDISGNLWAPDVQEMVHMISAVIFGLPMLFGIPRWKSGACTFPLTVRMPIAALSY